MVKTSVEHPEKIFLRQNFYATVFYDHGKSTVSSTCWQAPSKPTNSKEPYWSDDALLKYCIDHPGRLEFKVEGTY